MFTEVPASDDRRIKTGGFKITNKNTFDHKSTKSGTRDFLAESLVESQRMFRATEGNPIFSAME